MNNQLLRPGSELLKSSFPFVKILDELGEGGQKYVYRAESDEYGIVAFKLIKVQEDYDRTLRELEAAARFSPPRFPMLLKYGEGKLENQRFVYIVEELIEGTSLRERLNNGSLGCDEAVKIGLELIIALGEVADHKLVHRDVKPENIMLGPNGRVVLLDFGIARHLELNSLTHDLAIFGPMTPGYAAPEQIKNEKRTISTRTDIFSWGIVMYEMITGFNPFTIGCKTPSEAVLKTLQYDPPKIQNCNTVLSDIINSCIHKSIHRRPAHPNLITSRLLEVQVN